MCKMHVKVTYWQHFILYLRNTCPHEYREIETLANKGYSTILTVLLNSPMVSAISFFVTTKAMGYPFPRGFPTVIISGTTPGISVERVITYNV